MLASEVHTPNPASETVPQGTIILDALQEQLRTGPNATYYTRPNGDGDLLLAPGQILGVWGHYDDGTRMLHPVYRYVGEDHKIYDLTRDEQGALPPVVASRLSLVNQETPRLNNVNQESKVMIKGWGTNTYFDPDNPTARTQAATAAAAHVVSTMKARAQEVRQNKAPLFKKVALGAAELVMKTLGLNKSTGQHHKVPRRQRTPRFA